MINLIADNKEYKVDWLEFSDGALTCKINGLEKGAYNYISLSVCPTTPCKQVTEELILIMDALRYLQVTCKDHILHIPYLPYMRADRVFEQGNPNGFKTFEYTLEGLGFNEVHIADPHNEDVLNKDTVNYIIKDQLSCLKDTIKKKRLQDYDYLISPDKGASKKIVKISEQLNVPFIQAGKVRDLSTGRIVATTLETDLDLTGCKVLILDDIGDRNGTFVPLITKLLDIGCVEVDLYVTHLIGANKLENLKGLVNKIHCYHIVGEYINREYLMRWNERNGR